MLAPLPVGSVTVLACRDTLAAVAATRFSGSFPSDPCRGGSAALDQIKVNDAALPRGVSVVSTETLPSFAVEVYAPDLDALHDMSLARAWRDGAWDISVTLHPPLDGPSLGLVDAHRDWEPSALPIRDHLMEAARQGRLATWLHKPMLLGPQIRVAAHARKDATLAPDGGRDGPMPSPTRPIWGWRGSRAWLIRLGRSTQEEAPRERRHQLPATPPQLRYIALLRRKAGLSGPVGPLSLQEASAMIDDLLLRSTPEGDGDTVS